MCTLTQVYIHWHEFIYMVTHAHTHTHVHAHISELIINSTWSQVTDLHFWVQAFSRGGFLYHTFNYHTLGGQDLCFHISVKIMVFDHMPMSNTLECCGTFVKILTFSPSKIFWGILVVNTLGNHQKNKNKTKQQNQTKKPTLLYGKISDKKCHLIVG